MNEWIFHRDLEPGVTTGWLVVSNGNPGDDALVAPAVMLVDEDGVVFVRQTGDAERAVVAE